MARKFYVVWEGRAPGIYDSWEEAKAQVDGYPGARYRSYGSQEAATEAFRQDGGDELYALSLLSLSLHSGPVVNYEAFPEIKADGIAVDAACARNPGPVEYQGVVVGTGEVLFHFGPVDDGTSNVGEFLALVHALALCEQRGWVRTIYSDSITAQAWVRNRRARTALAPTPRNAKLLEMVQRAERWLQTHTSRCPVVKWQTELWGEIPADFGRK